MYIFIHIYLSSSSLSAIEETIMRVNGAASHLSSQCERVEFAIRDVVEVVRGEASQFLQVVPNLHAIPPTLRGRPICLSEAFSFALGCIGIGGVASIWGSRTSDEGGRNLSVGGLHQLEPRAKHLVFKT